MLKPVEKPIKFIKNLSTKGKSYPITHVSAVIDDNGESVKSTIDSLKNKGSLTKVTWLELKDKRDAGKLIPGSLYRITDYNCTTTQENTQSAGHQFDIVLLALSENKLAEEGWAMMHDNIYDVTFSDGVTKKCYLYGPYDIDGSANYNIIEISTLLGYSELLDDDFIIDGNTITIANGVPVNSTDLTEENLPYNYFQNSKLEAWKVWYCLDNDKSRFAWAMDVEPASVIITDGRSEFSSIRTLEGDANNKYCWLSKNSVAFWTDSETPQNGDSIYNANAEVISGLSIVSYSPLQEGRGVIYRLIDEWNNDVGYDFKNIQFVRKLTDGEYDPDNGEDTWCYTFNGWDGDNSACVDATTDITLGFKDTDNNIHFIKSLGDNVFLEECCDIKIMDTGSGLITLSSCLSTTLIATYIFELASENGAIYIGNKKVLTEE